MNILDSFPFWDFLKNKIGKFLGLILGFLLANFIGAAIGFIIGALIDKFYQEGSFNFDIDEKPRNYLQTDFILSTLLLASSVLKSDAEKDEKEIAYIRDFILAQFGKDELEKYMTVIGHSKLKEPDLKKITQQIRINSPYETRLQIIHFLFGLAKADNLIHDKEIANIKIISIHLSVSAEDFESLKAMFISIEEQHFNTLQLNAAATDQEVKESYRKLALKYHPDKTTDKNKDAEENFLRLKEAYDFIKNKRGFA